jgi:citrate lyase subunit beta / citryl-CoA lyase
MTSERRRRSWLLVPVSRPELIEEAVRSSADVIVLDIAELVAEQDKPAARRRIGGTVSAARAGGAEVYVQIDASNFEADLEACVQPGLAGVVVSRAESPQQIERMATLMGELEGERVVARGTLTIVPALETAPGHHKAYEIACASARVRAITLGRADLVMDLRPEPSGEIHLMPYLMQRLIVVAGAAGVVPIGAWWRAPDRGLLASPENTLRAARRGRAIGFKGAMCLRANQVDALNATY